VEFSKVCGGRHGRRRAEGRSRRGGREGEGTITEHGRGDKVIVFKFKRKKQYRRTQGHRQDFTAVKVSEILA
jgi:large subunit ribosomal protein L21